MRVSSRSFLLVGLGLATTVGGFQAPVSRSTRHVSISSPTARFMSEKPEYSRDLLLREEAESPFRKVRFFFYFTLGGGAMVSLILSLTRIAAALAGINPELMEESLTNAAVDIAGIIGFAFLNKQDLDAQNSRLKRASKGAELAKLTVKASKSIISGEDVVEQNSSSGETFTTTLASLRRGRGIEKRVVIVAAGPERIAEVTADAISLEDKLSLSDLLVIPVVLPQGNAPQLENADDLPDCLALPVGNAWKSVVADESAEAGGQGVDVEKEGFCVILKKNGRVGQRTRGIFLNRMVGEVTERRELGMDVSNI